MVPTEFETLHLIDFTVNYYQLSRFHVFVKNNQNSDMVNGII